MSTPSAQNLLQDAALQQNWAAIRALAPERFDAFARPGDESELDPIARYVWNISVSCTLHCCLHVLEITFRNRIHNGLTVIRGDRWFDNPNLLSNHECLNVARAKQALQRQGRTDDSGNIVTELGFGFWTSLYGSAHEQDIVRPTIHFVFPAYSGPASLQRSVVAAPLREARLLRNRISHHEHVAFDVNLPQRHADIHDLISWMSPQMSALAKLEDNFPAVYGRSWPEVRDQVQAVFQAAL